MSTARDWRAQPLPSSKANEMEDAAKIFVLSGDSELAQLMRDHDWSQTPLGPVSQWPPNLRTCVNLILNSQHPMWIGWGDEATFLYNDAYIQVLSSAKHPWALGRPASEVWAEIWDICGPLAAKVFERGEATFVDEVRLFMNRGDFLEETYYSFSYSAICDDSGKVVGLFCPSAEVTARVLNARRLRTLSELSSSAFLAKTVEDAFTSASQTIAENPDDIPFSLLYIVSPETLELELKANARTPESVVERFFSHANLANADNEAAKGINEVLRLGAPRVISTDDIPDLPLGLADQRVKQAIVLPVNSRAEDRALGVLVAGINPTRQLDTEYRTFYSLVAGHVATAIANARAYDEERRRAEALAELDRAKTTFYSNVSHEFRTPLTLMLGPLEELLGKSERAIRPENHHLVEVAYRNGTRLLKLVNTLLDFSRIEAGRMNVSFQATDLVAFTAELTALFRSATDKAGLRLEIESDALPHRVYVNREMWEKIVLNLLSNAFKFTFEGGITIALRDGGDGVAVSVRDTGVGIPPNELPRVFERFHRVEGAKGRSFEGSGIGLSLVQELVKTHGGTIEVESEVGKGTTFHIHLPYGTEHLPANRVSEEAGSGSARAIAVPYVAEALSWLGPQAAEAAAAQLAEVGATLAALAGRPSLLLADDNRDMREYIERLLGSRYRIRAASNGKRALEMATEDPPDLVLTDVMMPEMDGFELLAALRANSATSTIPIIVLSARAGEEAQIEGLQHGADDYLVKPFSARELVARVENNLRLSTFRRETEQRIRESEGRFRALVSATSDVVYRMSADWSQLRQLDGRDYLANVERPPQTWLQTYIHPDDQPTVLSAIHEAIRDKKIFQLEHRMLRADGSLGWTFSRAVPMLDNKGEIVEWFGAATDITPRKNAEDALLRSEKLASVGRMAATIAHEINNPLEAITNTLFLALHAQDLPESAREYLEMADGELRRVAHITRQALGFYRESNAPRQIALNAVMDSTLDLLKNRIRTKNVTVEKQWDGDVHAEAVAGEMRQVFSNLLQNSLDAVDEGGAIKVRISTIRNGSAVRVTIADSGKGIEANFRERIFEPFFTTKGAVGTGLGLWVTRQIVEKHGGRIRVHSLTSGDQRGTSFSIVLPVQAAH
ncbi:multi-sensor signal transduction histidine kinase [Candidatus Koribacter versatilis Ellin345]|uniref:histidine kinase n=1 Tax=Koribacter versatilis (strain Ellin345) TaxID=204669 RepID=Q1IP00_KORVE|nr:ATP-binding protein [Candidatus Koribacter versatilis]ABF41400.1 multi-sensor signal transduction histidine kinase [Candidatus Koribacter versatilis Ellin345]